MRASTIDEIIHANSRVPATPRERSPKRSGENERSWWAVEGVGVLPYVSPIVGIESFGTRKRENPVGLPDDGIAAMADAVATVRVIGSGAFWGSPFVIHAALQPAPAPPLMLRHVRMVVVAVGQSVGVGSD